MAHIFNWYDEVDLNAEHERIKYPSVLSCILTIIQIATILSC